MISNLKLSTTKRFYCWIIFHYCLLSKCTQISSNITQQPIIDASDTNQKPPHILVDSQQTPLTNFLINTQYYHQPNQHHINNQKTNHHFSINTRKKLNDDNHHQHYSQDNNYNEPIITTTTTTPPPPYHHNLVVSYEKNQKSLEENIYNKNYFNSQKNNEKKEIHLWNGNVQKNSPQTAMAKAIATATTTTSSIKLRKSINKSISNVNFVRRIKRSDSNDESEYNIEHNDVLFPLDKDELSNINSKDQSTLPDYVDEHTLSSSPSFPFNYESTQYYNNHDNDKLSTDNINVETNSNEHKLNFIASVFGNENTNYVKDSYYRNKRYAHTHHMDRNVDGFVVDEPLALPLRPIIRGPFDVDEQNLDEVSIIYVEPRSQVKLNCEVDLDIQSSVWLKDGQVVQAVDQTIRPNANEFRFIKEPRGQSLTINNVMLEDDGYWQCEAENFRGYMETGRSIKLVVLSPPRPPYLLFDSRRLDASNLFIPVKENAEISFSCISEGGNPKPLLSWELLLNPAVDHHSQKLTPDSLEVQVVKKEKEKDYKINSGAKSDAKLPIIFRAHHNARVLCVMEHPSLKVRQNASIVLDVQYTPSFAITRTPGFGYPLREGIAVSLKCDVDSNPSSVAIWQKDDGDPPFPQSGDGLLNFTSIRWEHSGWYKCTARHLNKPYSSFGYYLNVRYDTLDVTSEPDEQNLAISSSSSLTQAKTQQAQAHMPFKIGQMEVELGGSVTLQCPQGSLGCWSHIDPVNSRLKGVGIGTTNPNGQYSLKDVVYQDAGIYKCIGQSVGNKKKLEVLNTIAVGVKGFPTVTARNKTPIAFPGLPLHLFVEFCANPPAHAARWLHGDRVYTPGNQYGADVLAYGVIDLPTPFCKEARLTIVHMHERVPRTFYFIVSSPIGAAEAIINVNFTIKHHNKRINANVNLNNSNLPIFSASAVRTTTSCTLMALFGILIHVICLSFN